MRPFEPPTLWPIWRVQIWNLKGMQHAWHSLSDMRSICELVTNEGSGWQMVPVGLEEKNRCANCRKAIERIERKKKQEEESITL